MARSNDNFPNLQFAQEVIDSMRKDTSLNPEAKVKILGLMNRLNAYGTHQKEMFGSGLKPLGKGWFALKTSEGSDEWRVMFRKIPDQSRYGLVYLYRKDTQKIPKRVWEASKRIAKREGWM